MKTIALLLLSAFAAAAAPAPSAVPDLRHVNGLPVDLAPLQAWASTNGPARLRPLPHWQRLQVVTLGDPLGAWKKSVVRPEGGTNQTVYLQNIPPDLTAIFKNVDDLRRRAEDALRQSAADARERDRLHALLADNRCDDTYTFRRSTDPRRNFLDSEATRRDDWQRAVATADQSAAASRFARQAYDSAVARAPVLARNFAMFTGQRYAGLEVWDFGK